MKYGKLFYESKSILDILYRNAVAYKKGNINKLNNAFAQLGLDDNRLQISTPIPLNSLVGKLIDFYFDFYDLYILASEYSKPIIKYRKNEEIIKKINEIKYVLSLIILLKIFDR
jgi:hypothetical protein